MKRIGIISDTHGCFDDTIKDFLSEVDEIWHAGDIGSLELADSIAEFKPLRAVHGNIDNAQTRVVYKKFEFFSVEGVSVLITHIGGNPGRYEREAYAKVMSLRPKIFVCGHSHILKVGYNKSLSVLHINPGAAGKSGFHSVRTALRFVVDSGQIKDMEVGEWRR